MIIFWVKIPPVKQLLISIDSVVEQSAWGRLGAAAPKPKRKITMDDGSIHRPLRAWQRARRGSQEEQKSTLKACDPVVHCGRMLFGRVAIK